MADEKQEQVFNIADARLTPVPDGSGAIATFTILGAFTVSLAFPANVVDAFLIQWVNIKREMQSLARLVNKVNHSKL